MDMNEYKSIVLSTMSEANTLIKSVTDSNNLQNIHNMIKALSPLVEFVSDDLNMNVLQHYCSKASNAFDDTPLDCLCKSVLEKLKAIESMLRLGIFDWEHPLDFVSQRMKHEKFMRFNNLMNMLKDTSLRNMLSAFTVLKHLEGHSKTLIMIGPNGSGKTSFANYMKNLDSHVKVIPASKPIIALGNIPYLYNSTLDTFNQELYSSGTLNQDLLQKLIIGMCSEHDDIAREYMATNVKEKNSIYENVKSIFDDFFDVKLDNSAFSSKNLKAKKGESEPFDFNKMSDGERVAFFYISTVITAPHQSFIIVDEPENHLNPAVYNKIWDRLIETRKDCQFIFISHTMEFISARSNYEVVKIKNFTYPDVFEFDFLGDTLDNIKSEYVVEIVGSRKPILFCEGSRSDYDYRIYESIFGEHYTIIPTGNCSTVVNCVAACNLHGTTYNLNTAIGIIDSDLKSQEEIEQLRSKNIYTLKCNEIEMLLVDEIVFKRSLAQVFRPESDFYSFRDMFFQSLSNRKQYIIRRLTKTYIDEQLKNTIIDDKNNKTIEEISANLADIFNGLSVVEIWRKYEDRISTIITQKDYDEALRCCCLEHGEIIAGIGNRFITDYASIALGVIRNDNELKGIIKQKYFENIHI